MSDWFGQKIPKLGFGLMRLPRLADGSIDLEQTKKMVDLFIDAGLTYFDTAYIYDGGKSEEAARECLVKRHPRKSFTLASKLMAGIAENEAAAKQEFYTSLERTGAGYLDYYLLHALDRGNYKKYDEYHLWDFVKELKEKGLIKHYGFSFHGDPALLEELLTAHSDVEFIQLQINYADWENESIASRECYEIARRHKKSIVVMEPVKGGALANPSEEITGIFKDYHPDMSPASWAIRYAAGMEGILTVLSGMSNLEQMEDNLSYMKNFEPLNEEEEAVIKKVQEALKNVKTIQCTGCHYCTKGCPVQIPIPEIIKARNILIKDMNRWGANEEYKKAVSQEGASKASACVACGQCETMCPQHLPVIKILADTAAVLE